MKFRGEYWFLSNMCECEMKVNGMMFKSLESAFQAFKSKDVEVRRNFCELNGFESKKLGRKIKLREDWNKIKLDVMRELIKIKFKEGSLLSKKLMEVKGEIVEDNEWNDNFWGKVNGIGENWLGKLLMERRNELLNK